MAEHWKVIRVNFKGFRIIKQKFRRVYGNMCCIFGISDTICVINAFADGTDLISKLFRIILTQFSIFRVNSTDAIFLFAFGYFILCSRMNFRFYELFRTAISMLWKAVTRLLLKSLEFRQNIVEFRKIVQSFSKVNHIVFKTAHKFL